MSTMSPNQLQSLITQTSESPTAAEGSVEEGIHKDYCKEFYKDY